MKGPWKMRVLEDRKVKNLEHGRASYLDALGVFEGEGIYLAVLPLSICKDSRATNGTKQEIKMFACRRREEADPKLL